MLISISDHESFWGGVSDREGQGGWGVGGITLVSFTLRSQSKSMVGGEFFLSCQLLLVEAQEICFIQADLKCAPEGGKRGQQCKEQKVGR